jgi:spore coat protein A
MIAIIFRTLFLILALAYKLLVMRRNLYSSHLLVVLSLCIADILQAQILLDPRSQPQFINPLPIPSTIDARNGRTFIVSVSQFRQDLGLKDPVTGAPILTTVWGYNGSYPGPTIIAQKHVPIDIFWQNNLVNSNNQPLPHLLPIDVSVHWALDKEISPLQLGIPIVTHLHGGHTESESDGGPEAWFTPNFRLKGRNFVKGDIEPYHYDNDQEAATLWYHDHALGITRLNVYAGLAGYYLLTDDHEQSLKAQHQLPADPYDIGLAIQDRMFTNDGQLYYPSLPEEPNDPTPSALPEFFGNFILVNGKAWPVLEVEPRAYRYRILNGSDSRYYDLFLSSGQVITQIGSDNGLLPAPIAFEHLLIGTGERKDVIIDFSNPAIWGHTIILRNTAKTPFPKGSTPNPLTTGRIMAFKVTRPLNTAYPQITLPASLRAPIVPLQTDLPPRQLILFEGEDEFDRLKTMLGTVEQGALDFNNPITENPKLNATEIWEFYNETVDAHTIHLHLVHMQLISRQKFNATIDEETGKPTNIRLLGNPAPPGPDEAGWKDTYIMYPGEVTRIVATFDRPGLYEWHCHILSHEDHEMMRPFFVGQLNEEGITTKIKDASKELEQQLQLKVLPNPFSGHLQILFTLAKESGVIVNLYDAKGSRVLQIYNGKRSEGMQRLTIDGTKWSNGNYFAEIIIGNERIVRKLTLQK